MEKKYIYLAVNGLALSALKTKYATTNFKDFINWFKSQKNKDHFVELEAWKVEEGVDLNQNNMTYIGDADQLLKREIKNKQVKSKKTKKKVPVA